MATDQIVDVTPVTPDLETPETNTATTGDATGTNGGEETAKTFTQADVDRIISERLKKAESKAAEAANKARQEAERKAAEEQGQYQKLYEQTLAEKQAAEERAKAIELATLRERIARAAGLPDALAARLQGEDEDTLTADAKALAKLMPKPPAPNINAAPGSGAAPIPGQMTDAERVELAAIYGVNPKYF